MTRRSRRAASGLLLWPGELVVDHATSYVFTLSAVRSAKRATSFRAPAVFLRYSRSTDSLRTLLSGVTGGVPYAHRIVSFAVATDGTLFRLQHSEGSACGIGLRSRTAVQPASLPGRRAIEPPRAKGHCLPSPFLGPLVSCGSEKTLANRPSRRSRGRASSAGPII